MQTQTVITSAMEPGSTLGIDVGERRIGVASGDATGTLATPLLTIERTSDRAAVVIIARLAQERGAGTIIVGVPLASDGASTPQATRIRSFARKLRGRTRARVVFWNEAGSTQDAARYQNEMPGTVRQGLDAAAAAVILQDYLDQRPMPAVPVGTS